MSMSEDILKIGIEFVKKNKTYPSIAEMVVLGVKRDTIRRYFGNLAGFHDKLYRNCREYFFDVTKETQPKLDVSKHKMFIITTAVTGDEVHKKALLSLETYCRRKNGKLLIHVSKGNQKLGQTLDPALRGKHIVTSDIALNSNLKLINVLQSGSKTDPTSGGISRIGKRDSSIILASPKQRLLYTATGIDRLPHATMGTGAITFPKYDENKMSGYVAAHDHVMGAIVVEIKNKDIFHFRQIQFDKEGRLIDLGQMVDGLKITKVAPVAMVLGDWHSGKTCPIVKKVSYDITKKLGIKQWVLHDVYDSHSNNHHENGKLLLLSKKAGNEELNLVKELTGLSADLAEMSKVLDKITIVKSNHDEFLDRYLDSGSWIKHPYNTAICLELAQVVIKSESPVQYAVDKFGGKNKKVTWLKRDESYKIAGIECGAHGDKGPNGTRGSLQAIEKSYDRVVIGHQHTPGILRQAWCVGTSTLPYPDYGTGPSSWMNTHCLIYPNGMRQMINIIDGEYSIE